MNRAAIEECFRRLREANPQPRTELEYGSVFQLLVAVILSAQATDRSVNLATRGFFPGHGTPEGLLALGEAGLAEAIRTSPAQRILTLNLVPTADETPSYTASRHIEVLAEHAPGLRLDTVVADPTFVSGDPHLATFVRSLGADLVVAPVRMRDGSARHDPLLLASVYAGIMGL